MSSIRYTIRSVPDHVDRALRERATKTGQSLNAIVLETLASWNEERIAVLHTNLTREGLLMQVQETAQPLAKNSIEH